ncbi:hypothetical protein COCMIDRAFT_38750 [Bipolaris oryzae ATCC 44560]|uniref:Cytochrome P450 n=1 Tax=Bipolaris oryzae ATCC 44560 TaxID=930090 RepID=W6ZIC9_COCMI|nr:uncharacterized protein COCMIDRAFT_38750 [Bipolaris oryzae ATCC 44560]EUC43271.1 hypothetical protein COCMIDRAFT_38750 [Bipolaris oryzae ATCC 44560]
MSEWAKRYGNVYSLTVGPSNTIVLSGRHAVKQVLDKKSAVSSDRPTSLLRQQLLTGGDHLLWMDATPQWRGLRKLIHADLTEVVCTSRNAPLQQAEAVQMLYDMMQSSADWKRHIERYTNSVVLSIIYGIRWPDINSSYILQFEQLLRDWTAINQICATPPIDVFPVLNWVSERFLGNWKSRARVVHDSMRELYDGLHEVVLRRRERIGSINSIVDRILDQNDKSALTFHEISNHAGVAIKGGSDTSATVLFNFALAMVLHPDIQKKAQAEIDREVSSDRIPNISDVGRLSYVMSIIKEVLRWRPVGGIGIPHQLSEDVWLDDQLLPKGSTLLLNAWAIHQDEKRYPNPDKFDPNRFQGWTAFSAEYANVADPEKRDHYAYGNGRRICPGIHLAERSLFSVVSKMLWAFDIEFTNDPSTGKSIIPDSSITTGYNKGLVLCVKDFPVEMKVRSTAKRSIVEESYQAACTDIFAKYDVLGTSSTF